MFRSRLFHCSYWLFMSNVMYDNNSNYKNNTMIRKETVSVMDEHRRKDDH